MSAELPMLDVYIPMMKAAAIIAAGQLRLFDALADGPRDIAALASALEVSEGGIRDLADFLVAQSYLEKRGTTYANAPRTAHWFTASGHVDYGAGLLWSGEAWTLMAGLAEAVRNGGPDRNLWDRMAERPGLGAMFSRYMHAFAHHLTPDLLEYVTLPSGARRLLDLGGSHGLHSISFCEHHPELSAVIVDLESALGYTQELIADNNLSDRISLLPGDLLGSNWGSGYDAVFYLSVAHNQTADDNREIIKRIGRVLKPGGILVLHEYVANLPLPSYYGAFQLTLLVETGTQIVRLEDLREWLAEGGFGSMIRFDLTPMEKGSIFIAQR